MNLASRVRTGLFTVTAMGGIAGIASAEPPLYFDYPAIQRLTEQGFTPTASGTYEVWLWGKGSEQAITIGTERLKASSRELGWKNVGRVTLEAGRKVAVAVPALGDGNDNSPGYIALATDASFDPRRAPLGYLRTLNDGNGFMPATGKESWLKRREALRSQIRTATGLAPMPPKGPLHAHVSGKQLRDGYSIERVVLETFPGFYLSGNLFRPAPWVPVQADPDDVQARKKAWEANRAADRHVGVLCPHGHWTYGRAEPEVQKRCKQLARMGSVVFAYDMVGYQDSKLFGHQFLDQELDLMGFSLLSLQTWNSIRAMDFLTSLPDVDLERVACTGASGGGTQTFILAALDDRLRVAAPIVMVSQDMQGGCACENASNLRIGTDNSEIAALFAPKPQVLVCAHDWTWEFMTKGFPQLQATYALYDAADQVEAAVYDFPHNYNQTTRERVYEFFAKHLFKFDPKLSRELPLEAESTAILSTWDDTHPRPTNAVDAAALKTYLAGVVAEQVKGYEPTNRESWGPIRDMLAAELGSRLALDVPRGDRLVVQNNGSAAGIDRPSAKLRLGTAPTPRINALRLDPAGIAPRAATLVVPPDGITKALEAGSSTSTLTNELLNRGHRVLLIDFYNVGENRTPFTATAATEIRHFSCYNRSTAAERVQDIVTALNHLRDSSGGVPVHVVAVGAAGPLATLARAQTPFVATTVIDANQFDYQLGSLVPAEMALPGVIRLGGLKALATLNAPGRLLVHNTGTKFDPSWLQTAYRLAGAEMNLTVSASPATAEQVVAALR